MVNLQNWFSRSNSRRFHRINRRVQCFITPKKPVYQRQIFALGVDYYPQSKKIAIAVQRHKVESLLEQLPPDNRKVTREMFIHVMEHFDLFLEAILFAAKGKDPRQASMHWFKLEQSAQALPSLSMIRDKAPKTYEYLIEVQQKFSAYVKYLIASLMTSTIDPFSATHPLPNRTFKLDQIVAEFKAPKYDRLPLAQSMIAIDELLNQYLEIFSNFYHDHYLKDYPKEWPFREANLSIGGIALQLPQNYELFTKVLVRLYFADKKLELQFDGSIVKADKELDAGENPTEAVDYVAINFDQPDGRQQDELEQILFEYEIEETLKIQLPY